LPLQCFLFFLEASFMGILNNIVLGDVFLPAHKATCGWARPPVHVYLFSPMVPKTLAFHDHQHHLHVSWQHYNDMLKRQKSDFDFMDLHAINKIYRKFPDPRELSWSTQWQQHVLRGNRLEGQVAGTPAIWCYMSPSPRHPLLAPCEQQKWLQISSCSHLTRHISPASSQQPSLSAREG
jgi:hypothetical protein